MHMNGAVLSFPYFFLGGQVDLCLAIASGS